MLREDRGVRDLADHLHNSHKRAEEVTRARISLSGGRTPV